MKHSIGVLVGALLLSGPLAAQELVYSDSRIGHYRLTDNSFSRNYANMNLGFEADALTYRLNFYHQNNSTADPYNWIDLAVGYDLSDAVFVEGGVTAWKQGNNDNRSLSGRLEYTVSEVTLGTFYRRWQDGWDDARIYAAYENEAGLLAGLGVRRQRNGSQTEQEINLAARYQQEDYTTYLAAFRETDDDHDWNIALAGRYAISPKVDLLAGIMKFSDDNSPTNTSYSVGAAYQVNDQTSLEATYGQWHENGQVIPAIGLSLHWALGKAPHQEQALRDISNQTYRITRHRN